MGNCGNCAAGNCGIRRNSGPNQPEINLDQPGRPGAELLEFRPCPGGFGVESMSAVSGFGLFGPESYNVARPPFWTNNGYKVQLDEHIVSEPTSQYIRRSLLVAPSGPIFPAISFWNRRIFFDQKVSQQLCMH